MKHDDCRLETFKSGFALSKVSVGTTSMRKSVSSIVSTKLACWTSLTESDNAGKMILLVGKGVGIVTVLSLANDLCCGGLPGTV